MEYEHDGASRREGDALPIAPFLVIDAEGLVVAQGQQEGETLQLALEECHDYHSPLRVVETARAWSIDCDAGRIHPI